MSHKHEKIKKGDENVALHFNYPSYTHRPQLRWRSQPCLPLC